MRPEEAGAEAVRPEGAEEAEEGAEEEAGTVHLEGGGCPEEVEEAEGAVCPHSEH